jgi:hypothetical protein
VCECKSVLDGFSHKEGEKTFEPELRDKDGIPLLLEGKKQ